MKTTRPELRGECPVLETISSSQVMGFELNRRAAGAAAAQAFARYPLATEPAGQGREAPPLYLDSMSSRKSHEALLEVEDEPLSERVRFDCQTAYPVAQSSFALIARTAPTSRYRENRDARLRSFLLPVSAG